MKKHFAVVAATALFFGFAAGCISYQYEGGKGEKETESVKVFSDSSRIGRPYSVLGQARVSGNYQEVSRDRMVRKLIAEAGKCGADAILIVEQQVVPLAEGKGDNGFMTAFDYDDTNRSWSQLYRDVDQRYGNIRNRTPGGSNGSLALRYRRIIRAEFLKYLPEEGGTSAPAAPATPAIPETPAAPAASAAPAAAPSAEAPTAK